MSYGMATYTDGFAPFVNDTPVSGVYVGRVEVPFDTASVYYDYPDVPSGCMLLISNNNGAHTCTFSAAPGGGTRATFTKVDYPFSTAGVSLFQLFASRTTDPTFGISAVDQSGLGQIVSTTYPALRFLGKVACSSVTPTSNTADGGEKRYTWAVSIPYSPATTSHSVVAYFTVPISTSGKPWYINYYASGGLAQAFVSILNDNSTVLPTVLPEVFFFEIGPYVVPSSNTYGARVYSSTGVLLFDSGWPFLRVKQRVPIGDLAMASTYLYSTTQVGGTPAVTFSPALWSKYKGQKKDGDGFIEQYNDYHLAVERPAYDQLKFTFSVREVMEYGDMYKTQIRKKGNYLNVQALVIRAEDYGGATI